MARPKLKHPADVSLHLTSGADELNVAEFPLAVLGERPAGVKTIEFSDTVYDSGAGQTVTRKLTIAGSDRYGLPCAGDEDVLVGMLYLTKAAKFQSRTVHFSRYQLIKLLGWPDKGQSYDRLDESLNRWLTVTLIYDNAWWDKKARAWANPKLHILSEANIFKGGRRPQGELPLSSFTWGETIFASFAAQNLKSLDLEFYFRLTLAPAKRMYRFLDKRFGARVHGVWKFKLDEFACEHIGFSRGYDSAQLKRKMRPSIQELEAKGFLRPMGDAERYLKGRRRGDWSVVFEKTKAALPVEVEPSPAPAETPAEQALVARGVTASTAAELAAAHPADEIAARVEVFDWMRESGDKRVAKNPAGYLVQSIRNGYQPPKGFEPRADRERREQTAAEADGRRRERAAEAKRREQAEDARRVAEREHVARVLAALSEPARAELEQRALAAAPAGDRERAEHGLFGDLMRRLLIERQILAEQPLPGPDAGRAG